MLSAHKCTMHMKILLLNLPKYGSVVLGKPINAIVLNMHTRHKNNLFKWRFKWKRSLGTLCIVSVVVMESKREREISETWVIFGKGSEAIPSSYQCHHIEGQIQILHRQS